MIVYLTEKDSVARQIATVFPGGKWENGVYKKNDIVICAAQGHLLTLRDPGDIDERYKQWSLESLPIKVTSFRYRPIPSKKKILNRIVPYIKKASRIVLCTDAGREGELIGRLILNYANYRGKIERLWVSQALTKDVLKREFARLKPGEQFESYYKEALARQHADQLVGFSLTRAFTVILNELYSAGRVQTAVLALLAEREEAIERFTPEPYWVVAGQFQLGMNGEFCQSFCVRPYRKMPSLKIAANEDEEDKKTVRTQPFSFAQERDAQDVTSVVQQAKVAKVIKVEQEDKTQLPPLLYDLGTLQRDANKLYGYTAKRTLDIAQKLYDEYQCLSYPRTGSQYMGDKEDVKNVKTILHALFKHPFCQRFQPEPNQILANVDKVGKRVFDPSKLTDHHAIIPQETPLPENASQQERNIYELVLKRFFAVFSGPYKYRYTKITLDAGGNLFVLTGSKVIELGWRKYYPPTESLLMQVKEGDAIPIAKAEIQSRATQPPPRFTEGSLISAMKNVWRYEKDPALRKRLKESQGIGTPATRDGFIETLKERKYITTQKNKIVVTPRGKLLASIVKRLNLSVGQIGTTALWEEKLSQIQGRKMSYRQFMDDILQLLDKEINHIKQNVGSIKIMADVTNKIDSTCPLCGSDLINKSKLVQCASECGFVLWKNYLDKEFTDKEIMELLNGKKVQGRFKSRKTGKFFEAEVSLDDEGKLKLEFPERKPPKVIGKCPACGGDMVETQKAFGCAKWQEGCKFVIWKKIAGKTLRQQDVKALLEKGETDSISGFKSKKGKIFSAKLKLEENNGEYKVVFDFD